jgi:hypothetical protein
MKLGLVAFGAVLLCFFVTLSYADVSPAERNALVDLYNATNGPHWRRSTNWLQGDPCTDKWFGVTCGPANAAVGLLRLGRNRLNGTLPSSLGDLQNLLDLYVPHSHQQSVLFC